jgi:hypothetical protein
MNPSCSRRGCYRSTGRRRRRRHPAAGRRMEDPGRPETQERDLLFENTPSVVPAKLPGQRERERGRTRKRG